jgi:hypothetical protein
VPILTHCCIAAREKSNRQQEVCNEYLDPMTKALVTSTNTLFLHSEIQRLCWYSLAAVDGHFTPTPLDIKPLEGVTTVRQ